MVVRGPAPFAFRGKGLVISAYKTSHTTGILDMWWQYYVTQMVVICCLRWIIRFYTLIF